MDHKHLRSLLEMVQNGRMNLNAAMLQLKKLPFEDLGYAKIDNHRCVRTGVSEVIFCRGKTIAQIQGIVQRISQYHANVLATRAGPEVYEAVREVVECEYFEMAGIVVIRPEPVEQVGEIAVVSAGTSDMPVAEEAAVTAEVLGNRVKRIYDVGVAGIHRLLDVREDLYEANVAVVVAGHGEGHWRGGWRTGCLSCYWSAYQRWLRRKLWRRGGTAEYAQQLRIRGVCSQYR